MSSSQNSPSGMPFDPLEEHLDTSSTHSTHSTPSLPPLVARPRPHLLYDSDDDEHSYPMYRQLIQRFPAINEPTESFFDYMTRLNNQEVNSDTDSMPVDPNLRFPRPGDQPPLLYDSDDVHSDTTPVHRRFLATSLDPSHDTTPPPSHEVASGDSSMPALNPRHAGESEEDSLPDLIPRQLPSYPPNDDSLPELFAPTRQEVPSDALSTSSDFPPSLPDLLERDSPSLDGSSISSNSVPGTLPSYLPRTDPPPDHIFCQSDASDEEESLLDGLETSIYSQDTIADPDAQVLQSSAWDFASENASTQSSFQEDIGIFQQPSFSSEDSWDTCHSSSSDHGLAMPTPSPDSSSAATFNSEFSRSTQSQQVQLIRPAPSGQPPHTVLLSSADSSPPDPEVPAIISQDPELIDSWRRLFATASRPPTNQTDPTHEGPKYRQDYLKSIEQSPNVPFGDSMNTKLASLCRLYFVNINGISAANEFLAFQDALESLLANGVDIFGLSETNLDWLRHMVRDKCGKICNDFYGSSLLATSTSTLRSNSTYKPGGTCTGLTQEYCGRYQLSGSDPHGLGRWSFIRLHGKKGESLVVITAYRVCNDHIGKAGSSTAYHQEWHLLRLSGNLQPNPRKSFITDLTIEIEKWKSEGAHVILGGDFNENLGDTIDGLAHLVSTCQLTDVHALFHGTTNEPNTYVRGKKRLDYVFATAGVLPFIRFCGIEPFFTTVHSDHRGLFLDIDLTALLGGEMTKLLPTALRGISSSSPHAEKYITRLYKHLLEHNVLQRSAKVFSIIASSTIPICPKLLIAANRIDRDITGAMLYAENTCRQKERPPWSEALHLASKAVRFWKTYVSGSRNSVDVSHALSAICAVLGWDIIPTIPLKEAQIELAKAQKDLKACRTQAVENRQKFLSKLVEAAALQNDISREKALKRQLHVEAMKSCYQKLRSALRPPGIRGGITMVEVEVKGKIVAYTDRADVHRECLQRNRKHFNQAQGTPWTIYPLSEVGTKATKFKVDTMPDGRPVRMPADTFQETSTILDLLQNSDIPDGANISANISFDEFVSAIHVWNENTSTSPSGRHLGHYKLLVSVFKDEFANPGLKEKAEEILQLFVDLLNLASTKGFALDRWKTVVNVMIYKKPGVYLIDRLRVIHLFEADYNFVIGLIFGRRALYSGVEHQTIHPSQWAQPGRQCADVVVMRELTLSMAHMLKIPLGGFENDAAACYDRILMNMTGAAFERMGVPEGPLRLQEDVLNNVIHFLKTGFGITIDSYTSDAIFRIYGVGQGSKAGPVTWARISSILFQAQELLGHGVKFACPARLITHSRHSDGFVDDTTGYFCNQLAWLSEPPSKQALFNGLRRDSQIWERLLWSAGGLLEIKKCRYYTIAWKFGHTGQAKMLTAAELDFPPFRLTEGKSGSFVTVPQLDCDDSFRTLGIRKTISGDQTQQIATLREKSDAFAKGLLSSAVTPFEAWTGYFTIWYPGCNFPLAATFLSRKDCEQIQSLATNAVLTKCKFNRHFPRAVVFGSPFYGGLGWRHLYFEQGIQHILIIIKHLRTPGHFQSLLQINLRWYMLIAGVSFPPLEFPSVSLPHLEGAWLNSARAFLAHSRSQLLIPDLPLPEVFRENDQVIMDVVITLQYSASQIKQVNWCRLYLRAVRLSELTSLDGTTILSGVWKGSTRLPSFHDWPRQGRPGPATWALWRRTLSKAFCVPPLGRILASDPGQLSTPLGSWHHASRPFQISRWPSLLDPISNSLYTPADPSQGGPPYQVVHPLDRRMTHFISYDLASLPQPLQQVEALPDYTIPVELIPQGPLVKVEKSRTPRALPPPLPVPAPTTFADYCLTLPPAELQLIMHCKRKASTISLFECLSQGIPLSFCTDGGALKHVGSIGWVIATDDEILWECAGSAYGWYANSFRSEGLSHLSLFVFIKAFLFFYAPPVYQPTVPLDTALPQRRPWIRAATDSLSLLKRLAQAMARLSCPFPSDALRAEFDVIIGITSIVQVLPFIVHWEHVKGHQDAAVPLDQLTRMETLNIRADELATLGLAMSEDRRICFFIPVSVVELRVNSTTITSHYATHLRKAAGSEDFFKWFRTNYQWDTALINLVDWDAHLAAIQKLTFADKRFITKFNFQWLPTGHQQHKVDPSQPTLCPSCRSLDLEETETHLYQCPRRLPLIGKLFNDLRTFHEAEHTAPALQDTLYTALHNEIFGRPASFSNHHDDVDITRLRQEQTMLGWGQLFRGRFSCKWAHLQQAFLLTLVVDRRYYTGDLWVRKLINLLWRFNRSLWNARNLDRHGHTPLQNQAIRRDRLQTTVHSLYDSSPLMLAADRDIFFLPADKRLEDHHPDRIELWISRAKPIVATSIRDATTAIKRTYKSIAGLFTRLHPRTLEDEPPSQAPRPRFRTRSIPARRFTIPPTHPRLPTPSNSDLPP